MGVLKGRCALVTGGSRGIGRAIALAYAREGADVALNYLPGYDAARDRPEGAREVVEQIEALGRRVLAIPADVGDEASVEDMVQLVLETFGRIDVLVSNAGFVTLATVEEMTVRMWDEMITGHLRGTFLVTRAVLPSMLRRGDGRINTVSSQIGQVGREQYAHYAAAKAGIIGYTKSLAREVGPRGVLVNCIAPGPIRTGIVPATPGAPPTDFVSRLPLRRIGEPDDVAPTAVFLASSASDYYAGQTLGPNGGDVMHG